MSPASCSTAAGPRGDRQSAAPQSARAHDHPAIGDRELGVPPSQGGRQDPEHGDRGTGQDDLELGPWRQVVVADQERHHQRHEQRQRHRPAEGHRMQTGTEQHALLGLERPVDGPHAGGFQYAQTSGRASRDHDTLA